MAAAMAGLLTKDGGVDWTGEGEVHVSTLLMAPGVGLFV